MRLTDSTSLTEELAECARWVVRSPGKALPSVFERLARAEFLPAEEQDRRSAARLQHILEFSFRHVPHYRSMAESKGFLAGDFRNTADLARMPVLTKESLRDAPSAFTSEHLPAGEGPVVPATSSGTTGPALTVPFSRTAARMFGFLWHRQARWFRFDPAARFAKIRLPSTMPRRTTGQTVPDDAALLRDSWLYVGEHFHTGPELTFSTRAPRPKQLDWLRTFRPDYLLSYPGVFEELALGCEGESPLPGLLALLGIGSTATPSLRTWIEKTYRIPFEQNYGLNEVGLVAIRCGFGRYHVNAEHCLVEITDAEGRPCAPGGEGRLLVTSLRNLAMPLVRYDTGDLAEAVTGPCGCGRTLPSFGAIFGRYRRYAGLPDGTQEKVSALLDALAAMPREFSRSLRRYQIHQDRDNRFALRLQTRGPVAAEFLTRIHQAWTAVAGEAAAPLIVIEGASIREAPGGKILDFDSDFHPWRDNPGESPLPGLRSSGAVHRPN